jgi:aldehyde dehydrogenase
MNAVLSTKPQATDPQSLFKPRYGNYIGGQWVAPRSGQYFDNVTPVTGKVFTQVARSNAEDVELALDAAHAARDAWGKTSTTERANLLNRIAERIEQNLELIAHAETWDNGKPIRETLNADVPLMLITSAISPVRCVRRKAACRRSTTTPSPTTSTSRLAWSGRSSRGTSRC